MTEIKNFNDIFCDCTKFATKIPTDKYLDHGKYPIIDQGQNDIAGYRNDEAGIFTNIPAIIFGDHTRIIKYIETPCFLGADGVKLLCPKNKNYNCKFLYYQLLSFNIPNTGYNRHFKWLKEFKIKIPSKYEQDTIVKTLDKVNDLISLRKKQLVKLDELVKFRFIEMFGDPVTNPMGWSKGTIRDVVKEVKYGTSRPAVDNGRYPYLRMNNITYDGHLDLSDIKYINIPDDEIDKCVAQKGDILFNRTNSKELVGKTCIYELDKKMIIAGYLIRVRVNEKVLPTYLSAILNSKYGKSTLFEMCKSIIGQANINAQELLNIKILIPPINFQNDFNSLITKVNKFNFIIQKSFEKLETLKKVLIQKYFN